MLGRRGLVQIIFLVVLVSLTPTFAVAQIDSQPNCDPELTVVDWQASPELFRCVEEGDIESRTYLALLYLTAAQHDPPKPEFNGLDPGLNQEALQSEGWSMLISAAEAGSLHAPNEIGLAYINGTLGQSINYVLARQWLEMGVEAGDTLAPLNLARIYYEGLGVEPSRKLAFRELWRSVARGYPESLCQLAALIEDGNALTDQDPALYAELLRTAAPILGKRFPCNASDLWPTFRPLGGAPPASFPGLDDEAFSEWDEVVEAIELNNPGLYPPNSWNTLTARSLPQLCALALGLNSDPAWELARGSADFLYMVGRPLSELTQCGPQPWH